MKEEPLVITSLQNPRVKEVIALRDRRGRDKTGRFLIEGYRELLRAVDAEFFIEQLFVCPEFFLGSNEQALIARIKNSGGSVFACPKALFAKLSYRDRPDGLIAIAPQVHLTFEEFERKMKKTAPPFLVVAEAIEKPGNLGTILRSSDAVGLDGLIVCDRCTDVYNPNTVRASVGTLFTVPVMESSSEECLTWLRKNGMLVVAAVPAAEKEYTQVDLSGPVAIAVGTEQLGLSDKWLKEADICVKLPMCGAADSLNVAMAATLLMYEVLRQRRGRE